MFKRFAVFAAAVLVLASCAIPRFSIVRGSGQMATRDYTITGFDALEVHNAFDVTVEQGEPFQVSVTTDDNLFEYLVVEETAGKLIIRFDSRQLTAFQSTRAEAAITLPELTEVRASGASQVRLSDMTALAPFMADLSGASQLFGKMDAPGMRLHANGASTGKLTGSTGRVDLDVSGASKFDLSDLATDDAFVRLSGASSVTVHPAAHLDYELSGASKLRYLGQPAIGVNKTSGGSSAVAMP